MKENLRTCSHRLVSLCLAVILAVLLVPDAALTQTKSPGEQVPAVLLKRLGAQYVPEDDQTQGLTETKKLRRYKSILSEGAFAEKRYAGAANLHELLYLMMLAARGRTTLEGTPESGKQLMAIAERLAAESATPPGKRLSADLLLVRARLDELGNAPAEVADTLDVLVASYANYNARLRLSADTSAAANALIAAVGLAQAGGARASRHKFLRILANHHIAEPGTRTFLASEGKGDSAFPSRLFTTRLTMLDGGELVLPRDTMGKPTLLHFWTMERPGLEAKAFAIPTEEIKSQNTVQLADMVENYPTLNIIGLNLDTGRAAVENFVHQQGISWPVAFSGLGLNDPTAKSYAVIETPTYWLIGPDGRSFGQGVSGSREALAFRGWGSYHMIIKQQLDMLSGVEARAPYYRRKIDLSPSFVVVAVNLDDSRTEVEKFLGEHSEFKDWIHIFSGQGWHDPLARELDVYSLPRAVLVNREGLISRWATGGQFDTETLENQQRPATANRGSDRERRTPIPSQATGGDEKRWAELPRNLSLELGAEHIIELVLVGPGEFAKGSSPKEMERYGDEWPRRRVRLTEPWYMAVHPVTRGQFAFFVKETGYITEAEHEGHALIWTDKGWQRTPGASWANPGFEQDDDHPVVCVSFNDAYEFCQWLSEKTG